MKPGNIPWDVILIIAAAIAAISAMQQAGGLDYMVRITEKVLRANPKSSIILLQLVDGYLQFWQEQEMPYFH